jgi:glutathione S-transferase
MMNSSPIPSFDVLTIPVKVFLLIQCIISFAAGVEGFVAVPRHTAFTPATTISSISLSMSTSSSSSSSSATTEEQEKVPSSSTLTLYGHPGTRSPLVNWALFELGINDFVMGDLSKNPHPFKKIPCLTDNDDSNGQAVVVFESGAILEYLMDTYTGQDSSSSSLTKSQKAAITSWIVWANASLDPVCFIETPQGKVYDTGLKKTPSGGQPLIDQLDKLLSKQQYLVAAVPDADADAAGKGDKQLTTSSVFTLADVAVASYLLYVPQFFPDADISQWKHLVRYMNDCAKREAYGKAFGKQVQTFLLQRLQ